MNPLRAQIANTARQQGAVSNGFNSYSAGAKRYGPSQRRGPNTGMRLDRSGYAERDQRAALQRQLVLERMKAEQAGNYGGAAAQRLTGR